MRPPRRSSNGSMAPSGVSLPTVYAGLELLADLGVALRVHAGRAVRYDPRADPHHHLVCTDCGTVTDLEAEVDLGPRWRVARARGRGRRRRGDRPRTLRGLLVGSPLAQGCGRSTRIIGEQPPPALVRRHHHDRLADEREQHPVPALRADRLQPGGEQPRLGSDRVDDPARADHARILVGQVGERAAAHDVVDDDQRAGARAVEREREVVGAALLVGVDEDEVERALDRAGSVSSAGPTTISTASPTPARSRFARATSAW